MFILNNGSLKKPRNSFEHERHPVVSLSQGLEDLVDSPSMLEHVEKTRKMLQICHELPMLSMLDLVKKQVTLGDYTSKKTVVFDLDETLVHSSLDTQNSDLLMQLMLSDGQIVPMGVKVRPFAAECLQSISKRFEVIVFTASEQCYADPIIDFLDPHHSLVKHRFYRNHCLPVRNALVKDLRIFVNRKIKDLVIVDNSVLSFAYQLDNGVPILSWYGNPNDRELKVLCQYLKTLENVNDIREANRRKFSLYAY